MELLARYATILDEKHFDGVLDVFTDTVRWDFESVGAGPVTVMSPADIKAWLLPGFTGASVATHHAITNHRIDVDGDRATIRAHIHAEHWIDRQRPATVRSVGSPSGSTTTKRSEPQMAGASARCGSP